MRALSSPGFERGMIVVPLMFVAFLVASTGFLLLDEAIDETRVVNFSEARMRALEIAEVGLIHAELELRSGTDKDGDGLGTISGSFGGGAYDVTATLDDPGTKRYVLLSRGTNGHAVRRIEAGYRVPPGGLFKYALYAKSDLEFSGGSWSDAYDSDLGTYASQAVNWFADKSYWYADEGGSLGCNAGILLSGGGVCRGDALPGPLDITELTGGSTVTGDTTPQAEKREIPDPAYADFLAAYLVNDNLSIDVSNSKVSYDHATLTLIAGGGAGVELTGGVYIFNTFKMTGGGTLTISGPSKIYVTNYFEASGGGLLNVSGVASDAQIIAHPYDFPAGSKHDKLYVKTSGGSQSIQTIYAPAYHFENSGGGEMFGAAIANTIKFSGGSGFHYDKALGRLGGNEGVGIEQLYWMEK